MAEIQKITIRSEIGRVVFETFNTFAGMIKFANDTEERQVMLADKINEIIEKLNEK